MSAVMAVLAACTGGGADSQYAEAAPTDVSALTLEIAGTADEGAALESSDVTRQGLNGGPEFLEIGRARVKALNGAVRMVVTPIAELVAQNAGSMKPGDVAVFGPKTKNGATYKLTMKKVAVGRFAWKLEGKPETAADTEYKGFAAGTLAKGQLPGHGKGSIGVDFDILKTIDPSVKPAGKLLCGFAHVADTKTLVYALKGFTPDPAVEQPMSAHFVGHRLMPSKATSVRVAGRFNLKDSATTAQELVRARIQWVPGVGGRGAIVATEGDVPAGKIYIGHGCWDAQEQEGFQILRSCDRGVLPTAATCAVIYTRGQLSNCKLNEPQLPPEDLEDATVEPDAPSGDVIPPADMPSGS